MSMNDEQFEHVLKFIHDNWHSGHELAEKMRARDTAQREALEQARALLQAKPADDLAKACIAQLIESDAENYLEHHFDFIVDGEEVERPVTVTVQFKDRPSPHQLRLQAEAERDQLVELNRVNLAYICAHRDRRIAAQAQLAEVLGLLRSAELQLLSFHREHESQWCGYLDDALGVIKHIIGREAQAEQQEAQGAQAGMELVGYANFDQLDNMLDDRAATIHPKKTGFAGTPVYRARAAIATQPAAIKLPERKRTDHLTATDDYGEAVQFVYAAWNRRATQPAAGEPVAFSTEHGALFWHGSPQDWKGKPVQLYLAPPAAAHGNEAVLVGEAGTMPGTSGFTLATFTASDVPVGTKLYAMRAQAGEGGEV